MRLLEIKFMFLVCFFSLSFLQHSACEGGGGGVGGGVGLNTTRQWNDGSPRRVFIYILLLIGLGAMVYGPSYHAPQIW